MLEFKLNEDYVVNTANGFINGLISGCDPIGTTFGALDIDFFKYSPGNIARRATYMVNDPETLENILRNPPKQHAPEEDASRIVGNFCGLLTVFIPIFQVISLISTYNNYNSAQEYKQYLIDRLNPQKTDHNNK